jgi:hypothetical protein
MPIEIQNSDPPATTSSAPDKEQPRTDTTRWLVMFAAICVAMAIGVFAIVWSAGGFSAGGLSGHGLAALIIGSVLSLLLTVALMGLVFYSNRSELDQDVHDVHRSDGGA